MLTLYIEHAMSHAVYQLLEDGTYTGRIMECTGVMAFGKTLYACQAELREVLAG
ncbi:protein of unknown function UPF0150 [Dehalogenimonas lykanthroporepellens BL-DC-9]|nr:protein of unknown function UPF0150 [Dehalogenimonas lykanthroporepellens BL-DC-9]